MNYEDKAISFGQYKGQLICDIPTSYLVWLLETNWFDKKYAEFVPFIEMELKYRKDFSLE